MREKERPPFLADLWEADDEVPGAAVVLRTMYSSSPDLMSRKKSLDQTLIIFK